MTSIRHKYLKSPVPTALFLAAVSGAVAAAYFLAQRAAPPAASPAASTNVSRAKGLSAGHVSFGNRSFMVVTIDLDEAELALFWKKPDGTRYGNFKSLKDDLARSGHPLLFAANAGIFDPTCTPVGLHVEGGTPLTPLRLAEGRGNFYLKPNGVFVIDPAGARIMPSTDYPSFERGMSSAAGVKLATQSGPLLVSAGRIHPAFRPGSAAEALRSGVGVASARKVVFALSEATVNFETFARLFGERLGCRDALYLDGTISRFDIPMLAGTANDERPGDFAGILAAWAK